MRSDSSFCTKGMNFCSPASVLSKCKNVLDIQKGNDGRFPAFSTRSQFSKRINYSQCLQQQLRKQTISPSMQFSWINRNGGKLELVNSHFTFSNLALLGLFQLTRHSPQKMILCLTSKQPKSHFQCLLQFSPLCRFPVFSEMCRSEP